ncbi:hypothetical protein AVEN_78207-1 [Araneus ventricosus]|uniref:Uncharacterized protein n=1 Tax=Araneus ventricosus TaxID=182803 RepID=A0A4Y2RDD9_ARAVE|nr:hypothetical protein AVEN_78207-1 [Araneus ventricosus]
MKKRQSKIEEMPLRCGDHPGPSTYAKRTLLPLSYTPTGSVQISNSKSRQPVMKKKDSQKLKKRLQVRGSKFPGPFTCKVNALPLSYTPDDRKRDCEQ